MRSTFIFILLLFGFSCFQNKVDKNDEQTTVLSQTAKNHLHKFPVLSDTVIVSYYLDTTYHGIGPATAEFGSDRAFGYSDGKDSVYILCYLSNSSPILMDSAAFRRYLLSHSIIFDNLNLKSRNGKLYSTFYETLLPYYYLTCYVADSTERVTFEIQYETEKIDSSKVVVFNTLCNSFDFFVLKK